MLLYFNLINGTSLMYNFNCIMHVNHMGSHIGRTLLLRSLCYRLAWWDGFSKAETCCHVLNVFSHLL